MEQLEDRVTPTNLPPGFIEAPVAGGLSGATAMTLAPDGRFFVTEQTGDLMIIKNGTLLADPFVHVNVNSAGERGLLGVALDPDFATNQFVYVYYTTASAPIHNRVSRFTANGDVAAAGSETILLELNNIAGGGFHNGGALHFGGDNGLYIATGDDTQSANAQTLTNLFGKLLRINKDGTIPTDNPFFGTATGNNRAIWARGLRNPFTFAVQPGAGRIFVNDVGQNLWEEINDGVAGGNYGWPATEGETTNPDFISPLFVYGHIGPMNTTGCAIAGGAFYNPAFNQFPAEYTGDYLFADFCNRWIRRYDPATDTAIEFATDAKSGIVDVDVGANGTLYYLSRGTGQVLQIEFPANKPPRITQHPQDLTVAQGQPATFIVGATGAPPLSYQWQRNLMDISGATSDTYTIASTTMADNGAKFRCIVSNAFGNATSNEATLTVLPGMPPTGTITAPAVGTLYAGGDTIFYSGTGADAEDGDLPPSAFTWWVRFHHNDHDHPFLPEESGKTFDTFDIPTTGETSDNVWYRIHLRVTDSDGLTHESFRDVLPRKATVTLTTNPAGLALTLDGQPVTTPHSFVGVVGITRRLGAALKQTQGGVTWRFASWSDGGSRLHDISTPAANTTFLAMFRRVGHLANGLWARYWDNRDFTGPFINRLDPLLDFTWGSSSPAPSIGPDTFSSRWIGFVRPQFSQNYTFTTKSSDGVRVWLDGRLIIDNWTDHAGASDSSAPVALTAGKDHVLVVEHYENTGNARLRLQWQSPSTPLALIPQDRLFSMPNPVKVPWTASDVGAPPIAGHSDNFQGTFFLNGSGSDIGGTPDQFHWVHQALDGDGEIIARLTSQQQTHAGAKAGLMIRSSLAANAAHAFLGLTPAAGVVLAHRPTDGSGTTTQTGPAATPPLWLRLVRAGSLITASTSTNGTSWTDVGSVAVTLGTSAFVGLAVSSHDNTRLSSAVFDNVQVNEALGGMSFAAPEDDSGRKAKLLALAANDAFWAKPRRLGEKRGM